MKRCEFIYHTVGSLWNYPCNTNEIHYTVEGRWFHVERIIEGKEWSAIDDHTGEVFMTIYSDGSISVYDDWCFEEMYYHGYPRLRQ